MLTHPASGDLQLGVEQGADDRPPLRDVLFDRTRTASRRGRRADTHHVAMVVECGGMRGAAAAGALQALAEANVLDAFDSFHGSSAGACVAAYALTGQSEDGRKIYFEDICNRRVVNPYGLLSRPCMVDTDYIGDVVMGQLRAMNFERIIAEPGVLNVVTSAVSSGRAVVHSTFKSSAEIVTAMKATLRVPGLREPGVRIGDDLHLDGGITAPIPVFSAIGMGATHILVIGTQRASDYYRENERVWMESAILRMLYGAPLADGYRSANSESAGELRNPALRQIRWTLIARPAGSTFCAWDTIDTAVLHAVEQETRDAARAFLSPRLSA